MANQATEVDLIIHAGHIACVDSQQRLLAAHALVIKRGKIVDILPSALVGARYFGHELERRTHLLIPGLINAHCHAAMTLLRSKADDVALQSWLQQHIWPSEAAHVDADFVATGGLLAIAEMLKSGCSCFADMYYFPEVIAKVAEDVGIRVVLGLIAIDSQSVWAKSCDEYLSKGVAVYDKYKHSSLLHTMLAPHAPYSVGDATLIKMRALMAELGLPMQMHVHETAAEVANAVAQDGRRPLTRLDELGLLSPDFSAVHMCALSAEDIDLIARNNCHVVHCPQSNMKLASGVCPVATLLERGINVALGTDGAASNNSLDMLAEMKVAALLGKLQSGNATALPASSVLQMATINGARALGIEALTGSLEVGKAADVVAIELGGINTQPLYDPIAQLVYCATRDNVSDVWVRGKQLVCDYKFTNINQAQLLQRVAKWAARISA